MITVARIKEKFYNGDYQTKLPYVSGRKKYEEGYIFDEEKSVKWNKAHVVEENKRIAQAVKDYHEDSNRLAKTFTEDIIIALNSEYNLSCKIAKEIEARVYTEKHHNMAEYFDSIVETADIVQFALNSAEEKETCSACSGSGHYCGRACGACDGKGEI